MNSKIEKIFYNKKMHSLRSGWRMAIYSLSLFLLGWSIGPLTRIIVSLNLGALPMLISEILFYGSVLLVTYVVLRWVDRRPIRSVGFISHGKITKELWKGLLIGGGMMVLIFATEYTAGWITFEFKQLTFQNFFTISSTSVLIFIVGAFGEELLFRGYLFQALSEGTGKIIATTSFALLFALMHGTNPNVTPFALVNVGLAGIWLSIAYFKTRTLWFPISLHFSWNFLQNYFFSFPVSGLSFENYRIGILTQNGPGWITGGTFGPEGGVLATVILIGSTFFIYFSPCITMSDSVWTPEKWKEEIARKSSAVITEHQA